MREVEAMDKIAKDLEDIARQHNSKILYRYVSKFRGSSQSRLVQIKNRNEATIIDMEIIKQR